MREGGKDEREDAWGAERHDEGCTGREEKDNKRGLHGGWKYSKRMCVR